jgi:hypothetical protein
LYVGIIAIAVVAGCLLRSETLLSNAKYVTSLENPFVIYIVYEMFVGVLNKTYCSNICINKISATTFGVYLIHEHTLMSNWLFPILMGSLVAYRKPYFMLTAIGSVLIVFIVCSVIDLIRQSVLMKIKLKIINKVSDKYLLVYKRNEASNFKKSVCKLIRKFGGN